MKQTELKKEKQSYKNYMDIIKIACRFIARSESKVTKRCLIEGCRYGIGLPGEEVQKNCIYCGKPREEPIDFWTDVDVPKFVELTAKDIKGKLNVNRKQAKTWALFTKLLPGGNNL